MPSCLGLYIEQNLIKYAKVSKNNDALKVESFGVKFFENINVAIRQIVEETYSFKVPISVNASDEIYNEIEVFSLLSKKDIADVIKTEFESICYEKDINKNIFEQRYILTNSDEGNQKIKAIHIALPKTTIEQRKNNFSEHKINSMMPTSIAITSLLKKDKKETALIVNIESNTTITKIKNSIISKISVLNVGAKDILNNINQKENSYSKAYEICKNSTIYTESDRDLQYDENEYLEDIMPTLFQIVTQVRTAIEESIETIEKVYITGTGAIINNIDIYFQDYLKNTTCEVLKPSFINNNSKINIKDYIEVNSAISLAVSAFEKNEIYVNFLKQSNSNRFFKTDISISGSGETLKNVNDFFVKYAKQYAAVCTTFFMITTTYLITSSIINKQLEYKIAQANESIDNTQTKIEQVQDYNKKFNSLQSKYEMLISNIEDMNKENSKDKRFKNAIPNLLNSIMTIIPTEVQLISIENTTDTHVVIKARTTDYEEISFFKTKLKTEKILKNVVSDTGTTIKDNRNNKMYLHVTIEGELP